jgi:hypothetical protein
MPVPRPDLGCDVVALSYHFETRTGRLVMAEHGSCSQAGLVALFEGIDPNVQRIETFAGRISDGLHRLGPEGWESIITR